THATTSPPPPPPPPPPPRSLPLPRFAIQITAAVTSRNRYRKRASQTNANPKSPIRAALSPRGKIRSRSPRQILQIDFCSNFPQFCLTFSRGVDRIRSDSIRWRRSGWRWR
uniref:Uncharacterized protein n=1 Tax=Triticum urartu TaxID=4572 RepID=A0A8R7QB65_TRIUA